LGAGVREGDRKHIKCTWLAAAAGAHRRQHSTTWRRGRASTLLIPVAFHRSTQDVVWHVVNYNCKKIFTIYNSEITPKWSMSRAHLRGFGRARRFRGTPAHKLLHTPPALSLSSVDSLTPPLYAQANPSDPAIVEIYRDEHFPGIFIGGIGAARNFAGLSAHGIKSVLDVAAGDPRQQAGSLHYYAS